MNGQESEIEILGANANNLQNIDAKIPLGRATMIIGVSGSGKSSLLADTLATEANARMKRFLGVAQGHLEDEDIAAFISALPASIHFAQNSFRASQRTTVGTCSGLLNVLRRLFVAYSVPYAPSLNKPVSPPSPETYTHWLCTHYQGRATVWATPLRFIASDGLRCAQRLLSQGIKSAVVRSETNSAKLWETGRIVDLTKFKLLSPHVKHIIEVELGSIEVGPSEEEKLRSLLDQAFAVGEGTVVVELHEAGPELTTLQSARGACLDTSLHHVHPQVLEPFSPPSNSLLSFNAPSHELSGACARCAGTGRAATLNEAALLTNQAASMNQGALSLWTAKNYKYVNIQHETIAGLRDMRGFDPDMPWRQLPPDARELVLRGSGGVGVEDRDVRTGRKLGSPRPFAGFESEILKRLSKGKKTAESLSHLVHEGPCPVCQGTRWSPQARALRIGPFGIVELLDTPFINLGEMTREDSLLARSVPHEAHSLVALLHRHARAFESVGLGHLSGERGMLTLSEGESRRTRMAGLLNIGEIGLCLLLDEPARGLHEHDINGLLASLIELKKSNTLVISEHRLSIARAADHIIELGPGAGAAGGQIVYAGDPHHLLAVEGPKINRTRLPVSEQQPSLMIRGARIHNIQGVNVRIPLGRLVCITGVSGSGKSNFVRGVLVPALIHSIQNKSETSTFAVRQGSWDSIEGTHYVHEVLALDQRGPSLNRRSIIATFLGIAEVLRKAFASSPTAKVLGFSATDFGLNAGRGRCPQCLGLGQIEDNERWVTCSLCGGARFAQSVLPVYVDGLNIVDALRMSIGELLDRDASLSAHFQDLLVIIRDLGLGYLSLGRRVDSLSGGEIQRLRIAYRLWSTATSGILLVLDEPSAGLHPEDIRRLLKALDRILAEGKNSVVLIEHHLELIRASDWIVDFGPGCGPYGGKLLSAGSPEDTEVLDTPTGLALRSSTIKGSSTPATNQSKPPKVASSPLGKAQARVARAWLKVLLGQDVALPTDLLNDGVPLGGLAVELGEYPLTKLRPHEIGGLDREIAKIFLAVSRETLPKHDLNSLQKLWSENPKARVVINPLLQEIQLWGARIPASVLKTAQARLKELKLDELSAGGQALQSLVKGCYRVGDVRGGGARFLSSKKTTEERIHILHDARSVGSGYVELRDENDVLGRLQERYLDLDHALVAPLAITSENLSRLHPLGRCSACQGIGQLPQLDDDLLLRTPSLHLEDENLFTEEVQQIFKGVRRSVMLPFFRKLESEGLWNSQAYQELDKTDRQTFLFGHWVRPGHGSFLKDRSSDPGEVSSWLRWDGLYRMVLQQVDRSTNAQWVSMIKAAIQYSPCFRCEGTGLEPYSRLLVLGERSLHHWTAHHTIEEFLSALRETQTRWARDARTLARAVYCLQPLLTKQHTPLLVAIEEQELARSVMERVICSFTRLQIVQ